MNEAKPGLDYRDVGNGGGGAVPLPNIWQISSPYSNQKGEGADSAYSLLLAPHFFHPPASLSEFCMVQCINRLEI